MHEFNRILRKSSMPDMLIFLVALLILIYSVAIEPFNLQKTSHTFDGFTDMKIVMIADTQSAYNYPDYFNHVVDEINKEEPDLIVIVGDIAEGEEDPFDKLDPLQRLQAKYGVYATLGNHDYRVYSQRKCYNPDYQYAKQVEEKVESLGITVLRNEYVMIDGIALVGLDDAWACTDNYKYAVSDIPSDVPRIILSHNYLAVENEKLENSLVLSGHTHCGQVDIPFITDKILESRGFGTLHSGSYELNEGELYVTCGVTPGGLRLFTRPEISVIQLE